ncbi:hypothetical protein [Novosphingobium sp. 9]|uniref:hypothetical protein n=1 Tax=Novosphingobium sp. 9 TaxID=2025349 RepID=UPI0021B6D938|nr:hypothetical protein [Novosphingobium sp. 9]
MDQTDLLFAAGGGACIVLAAIAWLADHLRARRRDLDRVGLIPWTGVFFMTFLPGILMLGLASRAIVTALIARFQ